MTGSVGRIYAMVMRYVYLYRGSWPRLAELAYWPLMQMLTWGLLSQFLATNSSFIAQAFGVLIAAVLLWDVLFRGNVGVAISFLEEMWARNLGQLFASPLRPWEWAVALVTVGLLRVIVGVVPAALLCIPLYHYSIFEMGFALVAFFANLMAFGAATGLAVSAIVLRYGLGAENLAWVAIFAVAPLTGVYYPVATLPDWIEPVAYILPSTFVFEGMRGVLIDQVFRMDYLVYSVALNLAYIVVSVAIFLHIFRIARARGLLLQMGE
jgi:ABC-2 type transport system permease protein